MRDESTNNHRRTIGIVAGAVLLLITAFLLPLLQPAIYFVYTTPALIQWILVGGGIAVFAEWYDGLGKTGTNAGIYLGLAVIVVLGVFVGPVMSGVYAQEDIYHNDMKNTQEVENLPEADAENPRILPREVALQYADGSLQYPRHTLDRGDITYHNGTYHWSHALEPDGLVNTFIGQQVGAVYINMSTSGKDVDTYEEDFKYGKGMLISDNYVYQLRLSEFLIQHQTSDSFIIQQEGKQYLVTPAVTHDYKVRFTPLPQVYTVPRYAGVYVQDAQGNMEHLSPEEASESDLLEGQNTYPYDLANFRVNAMRYQHGMLNKWFIHEDVPQIAEVPGKGNSQPFTVPTEDGLKYFVATEPWGQANGIYQVYVFDAQTGEASVKKYSTESSLYGPERASSKVMSDPEVSRLNNVHTSEPIPVVVDGSLYWKVRVVPNTSSGITYIAFVDAHDGDVIKYETDEGTTAFLREGPGADEPEKPDNDSGESGGGALEIVVTDENGNVVDRITVSENASVTIQQTNNNSTASA